MLLKESGASMTETKLRELELQNHLLRREVTRLAKRAGEKSKHGRRVNAAFNDAVIMAGLHAAHQPTSRRYMIEHHGFTQTRWENAMGLLRMARVVTRHHHWASADAAHIGDTLERVRERAITEPEAFKARLNKHAFGRSRHKR